MFEAKIPKILIYGASSQVGASVALYLTQKQLATCTCLLRNANSSIFFEINSIPFHITSKISNEDIKNIIQSHDAILDFTYPSVQANEILDTIKSNMKNIIAKMATPQKYFHISSIMAYGLPDGEKNLKYYNIPRASYGYIKRKAELIAKKLGTKYNVPIYNFRLGQVHGFLQSVNTSYRTKLLTQNTVYIDGNEKDKVNIIFIGSLCHAILDCVNNQYKPNIYTLVNYPQWTLADLYSYYNNLYNLKTNIIYHSSPKGKKSDSIISSLLSVIKPYRPLLETYLLLRIPFLYKKVKGKFRQTTLQNPKQDFEYIDFHILGTPTSSIIQTKYSALDEVRIAELEMEQLYNQAIYKNTHG